MKVATVVVVGASTDRRKYGNRAVRAYVRQGFDVYPVNPHAGSVEGRRAYPSLAEVPLQHMHRVTLYVPPAVGLQVIEQLAGKQVDELWLNPGAESPELIARAEALGLPVKIGCSILDVGVNPHGLD
jgi:predicted CoA-binding protein